MTYSLRPVIQILGLAGAITLVGCGSMTQIAPGTPLQTVISQYGQPSVSCANPDGTKRVVWSQEPEGELAWGADVDANGTVTTFTQVLRPSEFVVLNEGSWDAQRVNCHFGPPSRIETYPDNPNQVVWHYNYYSEEPGNFMILYITINKASDRVVNYSTAPNPNLNPLVMGA
jgi:hypothetical protein